MTVGDVIFTRHGEVNGFFETSMPILRKANLSFQLDNLNGTRIKLMKNPSRFEV